MTTIRQGPQKKVAAAKNRTCFVFRAEKQNYHQGFLLEKLAILAAQSGGLWFNKQLIRNLLSEL